MVWRWYGGVDLRGLGPPTFREAHFPGPVLGRSVCLSSVLCEYGVRRASESNADASSSRQR
jgi:hypothetical protein